MEAKLPENEAERIDTLYKYKILDTLPEQVYDDITSLASQICDAPIASVTLIDSERQWYKSKVGLEVEEIPRSHAFCSHAVLQPDQLLIVNDTHRDSRFSDNPLVTSEPRIRFYAGAPLVAPNGAALGTLCVGDRKPRELTERQELALRILSRQVVAQMELRLKITEMNRAENRRQAAERALRESEERFRVFMNNSSIVAFMKDEEGRYVYVNEIMERLFNVKQIDLLGKTDFDWLPKETARMIRENDAAVISNWEKAEIVETVATPDGASNFWTSFKFPFKDANGNKFVGGVAIDITKRVEAEARLNESEKKYRHLFEFSQGFICVHDLDGTLLSVNPAAAQSLGYRQAEMVGKNLKEFLASESRPYLEAYLERIRKNSKDEGLMFVKTRTEEDCVWQYSNMLYTQIDAPPYVIGYAQDVTELKRAQKELRSLSLTDDLTRLYNRRGFFTLAAQALKVANRTKQECLLVYADLDGLKKVNDALGHDAGSAMIVDVSKIFKSFFRESDILARIGGDEFVILVQNSSANAAETIKKRLQARLDEFNENNSRPYSISVSIGVADFTPRSQTTIEDLIKTADEKMYAQKRLKNKREDKF